MAKGKKDVEKEESENIDQIESILAEKSSKGMHLGSRSGDELTTFDKITTGSFFMDQILGGGYRAAGFARVYAEPEQGKSSMGLCWAKHWQDFYKDKAMVIIFNAEGRISTDLVQRAGLNTNKEVFRIVDTNKSDFIYTMIERLVTDNPKNLRYYFLVDSTDSCERTVDMEKTIGEAEKIGGSATIMSAAGKRLSLIFNLKHHFLFMTSQVRDKVNTHGPGAGGKQPSGGNAPKFYSSLTCHIKKNWSDFDILENPSDPKSKKIGRLVQILLEKTYNETSGTIVVYPVKYGHVGGVWKEYEAMMICQAWNFVSRPSPTSTYSFSESYLKELEAAGIKLESNSYRGDKQLLALFESNPELVKYVHTKMREVCCS